MSRVWHAVSSSLSFGKRGLLAPGFYFVITISIGLWIAAYQYKTSYTVDVGGPLDDAYVSGFNAKEPDPTLGNPNSSPPFNYRWSGSSAKVVFPGLGNQPVQLTIETLGNRPVGNPPMVTIEAHGQTLTLQTSNDLLSRTFTLDKGNIWDDDLTIVISAPTFIPANIPEMKSSDPRQLGVIIDRIIVSPAGYGLRPFVAPPAGTVASMLLALLLVYLVLLVTTRNLVTALTGISGLSLLFLALILFARPELGLLARELPALCSVGVVGAIGGRLVLDLAVGARHKGVEWAVGSGSLAFVIALWLRLGGLLYPQFLTSDIMLHVHNVQKILAGHWVFIGNLPDGTAVPYPPALYVLLAPLTWLFGSSDEAISLILKWSASLADSLTCLALAWAGSRIWGGRVGGLAALVYAIIPAPFDLFSAGNYTNLFAQSVFNLTMLASIVYLQRNETSGSRPAYPALLGVGFGLTMLGHYGMMLAEVAVMGLFLLWLLWETIRGRPLRGAWLMAVAWAVAFVVSVGTYYIHFINEMSAQFGGLLGRMIAQQSPTGSVATPGLGLSRSMEKLAVKVQNLIGTLPALLGVVGAGPSPQMNGAAPALALAWFVAAALFALLDQVVGDAVRWYYLAAALLALLAGRTLAMLTTRGRAAVLLVALSVTTTLLHLLQYWVGDLIFTRYH